jgi:phosphoadenosine phosphosulfate reductase
MPRPEAGRGDLTEAWHSLHRLWKDPLQLKIERSRRLIAEGLSRSQRPIVAWSGGKDSTALLCLVREQKPDVEVIYNNPGVEFPETHEFIEHLANKWHLNLHVSKPPRGASFWSEGRTWGWPIFGKGICLNVERASRTGNLRPQLSALERGLVASGLRLSCRCAQSLRTSPGMALEKSLGCDLKFVGLRADESRARVRLWADHGDYFFVKRYYARGSGIWKNNPLACWTDADIWQFHALEDIPHCGLYDMGHTRNGCWTCAMAIRHGQLGRLRSSHPELCEELVVHSPMAREILRAWDFWCGRRVKRYYTKAERRSAMSSLDADMAGGWRMNGNGTSPTN